MKIMIVGCGKVGSTLTEQLSAEGHDIVIIDLRRRRLEELSDSFDVMAVEGNGSSFNVLLEAGVENTDLFIAVTGSDELNLLCCLIARKAGNCQTIARVRSELYSSEIGFIQEQLGISMIINPDLAAAREISKLLRFPSAIMIDTFARGRAELLKFRLRPEFKLDGMKVQDLASRLKVDVLVCGVERGDTEVTIPNGSYILHDHDVVSIMASRKQATEFFAKIGMPTDAARSALIVGGGRTGFYLATLLLESGIRIRIIEQNADRCEVLCEALPKATIIHGDGTDQKLLLEEGLTSAEAFVSLTAMDEENLLLALFALKHSSAKTIAKVNRLAFNDIIGGLDIGSVIYPKYLTANQIIKYVRGASNTRDSNMESLYKIFDNRAEALEFTITPECTVKDIPLMNLALKDNLLLCCICRKDEIIIPRGQDRMLPGDSVTVVTTHMGLRAIEDILK